VYILGKDLRRETLKTEQAKAAAPRWRENGKQNEQNLKLLRKLEGAHEVSRSDAIRQLIELGLKVKK
jgi:hypothetical protein